MEKVKHLLRKHKELDNEILEIEKTKPELLTTEQETHLHNLKKRKLKVKDEIAVITRTQS